MTPSMVLRAISLTAFVTTIVACLGYLFIGKSGILAGTFLSTIALAVAFAVYTAFATGALMGLFDDLRNPSFGILRVIFAGSLFYFSVGAINEAPLFSATWLDGMVGCVFFCAFGGCLLYAADRENNGIAFYLFSGMIAGFMFQPFTTIFGLAAEPNFNLALTGSLVGAAVAILHRVFINQELNKVINNVTHEVF